MKKVILLMLLLVSTLTANAQFAQGTKYVSTSLSGIGLSYSDNQKFRLGVDATAGYFMADCLMLRGSVSYNHTPEIEPTTCTTPPIATMCKYQLKSAIRFL